MTAIRHHTASAARTLLAVAGLLALAACATPGGPTGDGGGHGAQVERYDVTAVRTVQRRLNELGYDAGPVDGAYGPQTRAGILAFQRDQDMQPTGVPTRRLLAALADASRRPAPAERTTQTAERSAGIGREEAAEAGKRDAPTSPADQAVATKGVDGDAGDIEEAAPARSAPSAVEAPADQDTADPATAQPAATDEPAGASGPGNRNASDTSAKQAGDGAAETEPEPKQAPEPKLSEIELAGTSWRIAGGPIRAIRVTLKPGGEVEAPVGDWSWQRDGREIRLSFDSGVRSQSTRIGQLVSRDRIEGTGRDSFGRSWSWHGSRVSKSAANR